MKNLIFALVALASSQAFARRCLPDLMGNQNFKTRCDVFVVSTSTSDCHILRGGGPFPEDYIPVYHTHPWERRKLSDQSDACDLDLQGCQDLAFRKLEKFEYTNNCGDVSVGKSVDYRFQTLNADGTVDTEFEGRFKK
jgi:hypothetical protein